MLVFLSKHAGVITGVMCGAVLAPLCVELTVAPDYLALGRIGVTAIAGGIAGGFICTGR